MRIITGKAKGTVLKTLSGNETRPTAERVKEAVFSMLQFDIEDARILDLFCGSGQMALEAISRGASYAAMVDSSPGAISIIKDNVKKCRFENECDVYLDRFSDYIRKNRNKKFDLIFIDPPYASGLYQTALTELISCEMLHPATKIICESETPEFCTIPSQLKIQKQSKYGRAYITILAQKSAE